MASPFDGVQGKDLLLLEDKYPKYGELQPGPGVWVTDPRDDLVNAFNQGPWTERKSVQPPHLQEVQFKLFDNTALQNGIIPWKMPTGSEVIVPLVGIETLAFEGAIGNNQFRATESYGPAITTFMFDGEDTIHGMLRGDINCVIRLNVQSMEEQRLAGGTPTRPPVVWAALVTPYGKPSYESRDRQVIGIQSNWAQPNSQKLNNRLATPAQPYPSYARMVAEMASIPAVPHTVEPGAIDSNSVNEALNTALQGALTTSWIPVLSETMIIVQSADGNPSNRCRVQFKDIHGRIWYDNQESSGTTSAEKQIRIHPDAVSYRINFRSLAAGMASDIVIKRVPQSMDPWIGQWAQYKISLAQLMTFEPGIEYQFRLVFWEGYNFAPDENGFYMTASGLGFMQNARPDMFDDLGRMEKQ